MPVAKGIHKFQIIKGVFEILYALIWAAALFLVILSFNAYPTQTAVIISAGVVGSTLALTAILIMTISTVDSRNFLSDIYALNIAEVEAYEREVEKEIKDSPTFSEESKYDVEIAEFPRAA